MTRTEQRPVTLRISDFWTWLFRIGSPVAGFGLGFVVAPLVRWLLSTVDTAPAPLRILAQLPTGWAVAVTTVAGGLLGIWLAHQARKEGLVLTVAGEHVELERDGHRARHPRDRIEAVYRDGSDLVLLDGRTVELAREDASDLSWPRVQATFDRFGYPWHLGPDPFGPDFTTWVDGHPALDERSHDLLRRRARALRDERCGAADEARDELRGHGVVVRDRDGGQQYRRVEGTGPVR